MACPVSVRSAVLSTCLLTGFPLTAEAVPGPDSVAVVANQNQPESVALAETYLRARQIPDRQLCTLDLPSSNTMDLLSYQDQLLEPLRACLVDNQVEDRIEAVVLAKGVPLRVSIPTENGEQRASTAAVLAAWESTVADEPLVGQPPGQQGNCGGTPCLAAAFPNPYRSGTFDPGWFLRSGNIEWSPLIVTMLEGRTHQQAARLVASATTADAGRKPTSQFLFMRGANAPRAVLDVNGQQAAQALENLGFGTDVVDFDADLSGRTLLGFVTGSQSLGQVIEGNDYLPGALVDNLTSLGAVPPNFEPAPSAEESPPERQVSIARWVERGVAGVHGCTDEPLNNVFPDRRFLVDYAQGGTLGEAYFRRLPFAYWRNLVLGDPMAAPFAFRPQVQLNGLENGERVVGARRVQVVATDPLNRPLEQVRVFVDGLEVESTVEGEFELCLGLPEGPEVQVLVVAQTADNGSVFGQHRPKGWTAVRVLAEAGAQTCPEAGPDGGMADQGGVDAGVDPDGSMDGGAGTMPDLGPGPGADGGPVEAQPSSPGGGDGGPSSGCRCVGGPLLPPGFGLGALGFGMGFGLRRRR